MRQNKKLVIISVPYARIAKLSLSPPVIGYLKEYADVLIVAPFADDDNFINDFYSENVGFFKWELRKLSFFKAKLLEVSDLIRRLGFIRRFRNRGLMYYFKNQYVKHGDEGADVTYSMPLKIIIWILGVLGEKGALWKKLESGLAGKWYKCPDLCKYASGYSQVTLIQSANWGLQDRALAKLSSENRWRKVLIPYTTDQLFANGFLLNEFDAVCVQGDFELDLARNVHGISENKIYRLGSAWFRHMEYIARSCELTRVGSDSGAIIYAGLSNRYFSSQSEFLALDSILNYLEENDSDISLIYRPVVFDKKIIKSIKDKYSRNSRVVLHWPSASVIGLSEYSESNQKNSLKEYIKNMGGCKLLVMSRTTSYGMDVAFQEGSGVISNMIDSDGILSNRNNHLFPTNLYPGLRLVSNVDELIKQVDFFLQYPEAAQQQAKEIYSLWDYPEADFNNVLSSAVFENTVEEGDDYARL